jgi:hypothetical protein
MCKKYNNLLENSWNFTPGTWKTPGIFGLKTWKIERNSWKSPGKLLEFLLENPVATLTCLD